MNGHHSWPRAVTHCRVRSMGGLRERGSLVRRDGDALGGSLDQLGYVLVVILANNMTARQALRLGDITLRLKQAICCDLFRSFVTYHPPPTLHLHPSSTVGSPSASSRISYHRAIRASGRTRRVRTARECSGGFLPPSPPGEKTTASQDQAGQPGPGDWTRNAGVLGDPGQA